MFSFAWWLSLAVGFLSLSQEIVWVRVISFAHGRAPQAFSFVLTSYLVGIAVGAAVGKWICKRSSDLHRSAALVLLAAGLLDLAMPWLVPLAVEGGNSYDLLEPFLAVAVSAGVKSILFPIAHQLGSDASGPRVGRSVSRIYFANIIGSTLGPLVTGFVLLDLLSVERCFELSGWACLALAAACLVPPGRRLLALPAAMAAAVLVWLAAALPQQNVLQKVAKLDPARVGHFISNKHGVVHTVRAAAGDVVYGGNAYDGRATADVDRNSNWLERVYIMALAHPQPRRVLLVGMSAGAWTRAVQGFPGVERIDVVEINPGYLQVTDSYAELRPLLADPRVRIHIDDGRRWLKRHPHEKYDLIIQNTTWYWRAGSTNILSVEYMKLVRSHLAPGGIATFNTTGSYDVIATAEAAFPHAARYGNFVYGSDRPLEVRYERLATVRRPDGKLFDLSADVPPTSVQARLLPAQFGTSQSILAGRKGHAVITDDNMLPEYRHGRHFGPLSWTQYLPPPPATFR